MKTYSVIVSTIRVFSAVVVVEAGSGKEAEKLAVKRAQVDDPKFENVQLAQPRLDWDEDDYSPVPQYKAVQTSLISEAKP